MSDDSGKIIMAGALLFGAYLYTRRGAPMAYQPKNPYAVGQMPGSAGVGWEQIGVSALTGFLKGMASGFSNGANSYNPSLNNPQQQAQDWLQSGTVQDVYDPMGDSVSMWA